jgi:hypothetical protein
VRLAIARPAGWWRKVEGIVFFNMKYPSGRFSNADDAWKAMRRAVERITAGKGSKQRGLASAAAAD